MIHYDEIKKLLSIVNSMREPFNHHGDHVAGLAVKLARELGLPEDEVNLIVIGAHLHDIGKLLIRTELLNCPRKLTQSERAEMETHVMLGWAVANAAGYESTIQDIVRSHHENWDGSGYPDGLTGEKIPVAVQVVTVCDVYEALTSTRSYREAYSHSFSMAFMQKFKGKHFNPSLVDLFFEKVKHE